MTMSKRPPFRLTDAVKLQRLWEVIPFLLQNSRIQVTT